MVALPRLAPVVYVQLWPDLVTARWIQSRRVTALAPVVAYDPRTMRIHAIGDGARTLDADQLVVRDALGPPPAFIRDSDLATLCIRRALLDVTLAHTRFFALKPRMVLHPRVAIAPSEQAFLLACGDAVGARRVVLWTGTERTDAEVTELAYGSRESAG